jgi:hypothetical protein
MDQGSNGLYCDIFNAPVADIDFLDVIKASKNPIIDLRPLREAYRLNDKSKLPEIVLSPFLQLDLCDQDRVVFLGEKEDITKLLFSVPSAQKWLKRNPSIMKIMT